MMSAPITRHRSSTFAVVCAFVVVLLACAVCAADECGDDPCCDDMDVCHCACAFHIVIPPEPQFPEPNGTETLCDVIVCISELDAPRDLFRPPRLPLS